MKPDSNMDNIREQEGLLAELDAAIRIEALIMDEMRETVADMREALDRIVEELVK